MVAAARKETEASEKRNDQLKQQLSDTEVLLASQQEQLQDLKTVMQQMSSDRDENETNTYSTTAPSTPGLVPADKMNKLFEANLTPNTPGSEEVPPDHPLHFAHLIRPVLRNDLPAFKEFQEMFKISQRSSAPPSRVASGNYGSLNILGLNSLTGNNSTTSLPSTAKSGSVTSSPRESVSSPPPPLNLKDDKFYKRALSEDIEPTLRLDIAPGLSWMARRTVLNSITAGSLVVEPHPPVPKFRGPVFPCSLCGEARKGDLYARKFRFKTTESDEAQKYPLCDYCLGRVRATCDYIGFLRMVAAGHWRAENEDEQKSAWEENIRLREKMFWARLGGGVVPAFIPLRESPRSPVFVNGAAKVIRTSEESQNFDRGLDSAIAMIDPKSEGKKSEDDPFRSKADGPSRPVSIGNTIISPEPTPALSSDEGKRIEVEVETQLQYEIRKSLTLKPEQDDTKAERSGREDSGRLRPKSTPGPSPHRPELEKRLSLTIPGSFE
jgi:Rab guanine nucleotide exchange factor SEC2